MTQYVEDGYEKSLTTGTVFMDLSAAYNTVNHRLLLTQLYGMTEDAEFTKLIGSMIRGGLKLLGAPGWSVLLPVIFNLYTDDQHSHTT